MSNANGYAGKALGLLEFTDTCIVFSVATAQWIRLVATAKVVTVALLTHIAIVIKLRNTPFPVPA